VRYKKKTTLSKKFQNTVENHRKK